MNTYLNHVYYHVSGQMSISRLYGGLEILPAVRIQMFFYVT